MERYGGGPLQMQVKDYEIVEEGEDETLHTGRLVPVYRLTQGLTQRPLRTLVKRLLDGYGHLVEEPLPEGSARGAGSSTSRTALKSGHFPQTTAEQESARRRLVFDDFFLLQLGLAIRRQRQGRQRGLSMKPAGRTRPAAARLAAVSRSPAPRSGCGARSGRTWRSRTR